MRIFTPTTEVPFAGHPNVGTAFVLAECGELGEIGDGVTVTFDEKAGTVPVACAANENGAIWCELQAPQRVSMGKTVPPEVVADAVSLEPDDIVTTNHPPQEASVGLPFLMLELESREALKRARIRMSGLDRVVELGATPDIHLYTRSDDGFDLRTRMSASLDGVPEDPATGSANCALVALLSHYRSESEGSFSWRIAQGVEMGRPSVLDARTEKHNGEVVGAWIGGTSVMVAEGHIEVD